MLNKTMNIVGKVNKLILKANKQLHFYRCISEVNSAAQNLNLLCKLGSRKLIKLQGIEASTFLQGLITNDVRHLDNGASCMFSMFLNTKGRVMYDSIIYKTKEPDSIVLECDGDILQQLQKHLTIYRLRKKIDIKEIKDLSVSVLFDPNKHLSSLIPFQENHTEEKTFPKTIDNITVHTDPRLTSLGSRIIAPNNLSLEDIVKALKIEAKCVESEDSYRYLRHKLGIGEGAAEFPPGTCFPLEVNCDFIHGVSFHKGCYIGQELTARVHHTGVVRRRLMPIKFDKQVDKVINYDTPIYDVNDDKKSIGKVKSIEKDYGLAVIRVTEAMEASSLLISGLRASVEKPKWWPMEAPKDKASFRSEV